ncbi:gypsy/ty3 retroelement polyprotein [Tanacetum coccineum]|uniref:Gypsy/ty3 retroelement polyprotein n=1 Tax=Tanacetum coccineum TaxID=301880 RepID=A0ABQ4ZK95_9ASTR
MVSTRMDDATRQFINEAIQEAITAAMTVIQQRIDGVCLRQETLATKMQNQNNGQIVGRNQDNKVNGYARLTKLEFPKFNGDDVKGWIYRCNQFFQLDNVAENQKVRIASIHLHDKALDWHRNFERRNGLENLRQTSTIKVYQDHFDALLSKVDITESHAISMFLAGMNTDIAMMMFVVEVLAEEGEAFMEEECFEECFGRKN